MCVLTLGMGVWLFTNSSGNKQKQGTPSPLQFPLAPWLGLGLWPVGSQTGGPQQAGAEHIRELETGGLGSQAITISLRFLSPKMNVLFNPSYIEVSAGGKGPVCLTPFTARVSWGNSEARALRRAQLPSSLSGGRLRVPTAGRAHAVACVAHTCGCSSHTPSHLYNLRFR